MNRDSDRCHCGCTAADRAATSACYVPGCPYPAIARPLKVGDRVPMPPKKLDIRPAFTGAGEPSFKAARKPGKFSR